MKSYTLKIGPVVVHLLAEQPPRNWKSQNYTPFKYNPNGEVSIQVRVHLGEPDEERGAFVSEHQNQWRLYRRGPGYWLETLDQIEFKPRDIALIQPDWKTIDLYFLPALYHMNPRKMREGWFIGQFLEPIFQWWLTSYLALNAKGLVLHGSAVEMDGKGYVFFGPSEAGKTTMARLCMDAGATVLNDERIIIWHDGNGFQVTGTPWHGELRKLSSRCVPLTRFSLLKKATFNRFQRVSPGELIPRIMQEAFLPVWSDEAMSGLLQVCDQLISTLDCGELEFLKDPSIVDYVRDLEMEMI